MSDFDDYLISIDDQVLQPMAEFGREALTSELHEGCNTLLEKVPGGSTFCDKVVPPVAGEVIGTIDSAAGWLASLLSR